MIAYLDTNVALWLATGKIQRLTEDAQRLICKADLLLSPMVLLEFEYLYDLRRSRLRSRELELKLAGEIGVTVCTLSFAKVAATALDEGWNHDPFDRLIVANAKANGLAPLISADAEIQQHYGRTVW